jgi:hypothetical protein
MNRENALVRNATKRQVRRSTGTERESTRLFVDSTTTYLRSCRQYRTFLCVIVHPN